MSRSASTTVKDLAHHAGVSVGTVSRVLNGYANISTENRDRVKRAVDELGYEKCRSAEMLVARRRGSSIRHGNIGMVFADTGKEWADHQLILAYTIGAEKACGEKGFHALVELTTDNEKLPRCVQENKVDGLIVKSTRSFCSFLTQIPQGLPVVMIGVNDPTMSVPQIAPDEQGAGWLVTEYLWNLGHRRIAFLCTDTLHPLILGRLHGYESFLRTRRCYDPALVAFNETNGASPKRELTPPKVDGMLNQVMSAGPAPTAVIAANDWVGLGVYNAAAARGLSVPDDISVVGFDNDERICNSCSPPLTSYAIPFTEMGYYAALEVFERIEKPGLPRHRSVQLLRGELVERTSVRKIAASNAD